jgi:putative OPT family oligopeptide transporter
MADTAGQPSRDSSHPTTDEPFIPAGVSLPEITLKALALGFVLSAVLAGANAYLGLKVGITVSASIPAAVISMAALRMFRESNILENNIVQTAASAGEALAAGVIFTLPALVLLNYWQGFPFGATMAIALTGGILGVLFTIPLRRALVLESGLRFPEGIATAEVLKAGTEGGGAVRGIIVAALAGAAFKFSELGLKLVAPSVGGSVTTGPAVFGIGTEVGAALLAVGYIVGLNIGVVVFAGGAIAWLIAIPMYMATAEPAELAALLNGATGYDAAFVVWSAQIRYMGVGAMVVGGVWALVSLIKPMIAGVRSSFRAMKDARAEGADVIPRTERDTPAHFVFGGMLLLVIPLFMVFMYVIDHEALGIAGATYWSVILVAIGFAFIAGFLFASVAGYMAGLVGSSNNPISGVTIATILAISLILLALLSRHVEFAIGSAQATAAAATAILVGAVVCCAAAMAGDNMQDLKAGHIVGATPYKQQIMQIVGVVASAIVIAPVLDLLFNAYGLGGVFPREGMDPSEMLAAPQATLMSAVADGVFSRNLPWTMIAIGGGIAAAVIALDEFLKTRGSAFRVPVLAVAVGIYLPVEVTLPIFIGGMVAYAAGRSLETRRTMIGAGFDRVRAAASRRGLLFASGLITGEALMGILLAIPFARAESTDVFRLPLPGGVGSWLPPALAVLGYAVFIGWLFSVASRSEKNEA